MMKGYIDVGYLQLKGNVVISFRVTGALVGRAIRRSIHKLIHS